ncbi:MULTISPECIES: hypothetical protein [Pseudonocardiaceae]|uniref:Uncharacterized protein n=1 Tax=Prauserella endophytica TaxID=1592324 RepID=A0ABY2RTU5_9PSEU|nr:MULTISPECIES: hypothetical protein [Pseudonocardiaceae]TKG60369.1 hypothetical protein FCN18_35620 [Prauserella endophytica]
MHIPPYSLPLLRAVLRGTVGDDELIVSAVIPDAHLHPGVPRRVSGAVIGLGSLISVRDRDTGALIEDIRTAWITHATVQRRWQQ